MSSKKGLVQVILRENNMAIKEKEVVLEQDANDKKDVISFMEEYFGFPATTIAEFEAVDATEQFAVKFAKE